MQFMLATYAELLGRRHLGGNMIYQRDNTLDGAAKVIAHLPTTMLTAPEALRRG